MTGTIQKPTPAPSPETRAFWEAANRQRLLFRRCPACGHGQTADILNCASCMHSVTDWEESTGNGKVISYVVFRRAYHAAYQDEIPYVVVLVELLEGPRMLGNLSGIDPESVVSGLEVTVRFEERDGFRIPQFVIAGCAAA